MGVNKLRWARGERDQPIGGPAGMYQMPGSPGWSWAGLGPRPEFRWEHSHLSPYVNDGPPARPEAATKKAATKAVQQTLF